MSKPFKSVLFAVALAMLARWGQAAWLDTGPYGGSAQIIVIDPLNPNSLLAGTRSALLYCSTDAGNTWEALPFPHLYKTSIYSIALDPKQPGLYYVGVAEEDGRSGDTDAGVYRSDDSGQHWFRVDDLKGKSVFALAIFPEDSQVIAAGTDEGVWQSVNGGKTWSRVSPPGNPEMQRIVSLAFHTKNKDILYVGTPHLPWKTSDGGKTWASIHDGLIDDSDVFSIHVDATQPDRVFASACSGIYCSRDAGNSWRKMQGIPGTDRRTHIITQDPHNSATVYAGTTVGLWKSIDGGLTWVKKSTHSINSMAVDPADGKTLYLATESGGLVKSMNGGETYEPRNQGFVNRSITQFTLAGSGLGGKSRFFVSTTYDGNFGGMFRSEDAGGSWSLVANHQKMLDENLVSFAVSPENPQIIWGASYDGLLESADGGLSWVRPKTFMEPVQPAPKKAVHRSGTSVAAKTEPAQVPFPAKQTRVHVLRYATLDQPVLLAGTSVGLFVSADGGTYWRQLPLVSDRSLSVFSIFVPAQRTGVIAALTSEGLYLSKDAGASWKPAPLPDHPELVYEVALHPSDPLQLFAATSGGLFHSLDGGETWILGVKGLPKGWLNSVAYDRDPQVVFTAQIGRIYRSGDGGATWKIFDSDGLEGVWVRQLLPGAAEPSSLFAVTNSRGVYVRSAEKSASGKASASDGTAAGSAPIANQ